MPLANFAGLDRYMRTLDRVNDVLSRSSVADNPKQTWLRALYLARRIGAGKWDPGDLDECANVATKFREAGERQLLGRIQLGLGYALLFFSKYREAHQSAEEGLAILLEGYGENLTWVRTTRRMSISYLNVCYTSENGARRCDRSNSASGWSRRMVTDRVR